MSAAGSDSKKRLVRSRSGLRSVSVEEGSTSPFELREPFWIPDEESTACMKCQTKFDFLTRRHHCRRCGNIYCKNCCETKAPLPRMCFIDPVRVCGSCLEVTKKENEFYDKHLKTLLNGASFILSDPDKPDDDVSFICYLSSNHQSLMFDGGDVWHHYPVPLTSVTSMKVLGTRGSPGSPQVSGAVFTFTDANKELQHMYMSVANVPNRTQSVSWITALQKAVKFLNPSPLESP